MAITRSQTRKLLPSPPEVRHESPPKSQPTKQQSKKAKKRPAPDSSPPRKKARENPSPPPPPPKKSGKKEDVPPPPVKPKVKVPNVPKTPMPKFELVDECIVHKNAVQVIKDSMVLMCTCKPNKDGYGCSFNCLNVHLRMECGSRCVLKDKCQNKRFQNVSSSNGFQYSLRFSARVRPYRALLYRC